MENNNFWFQSGKNVKFFMLDYRVCLVFIMFLVHKRSYTFLIMVSITVLLYILEVKNRMTIVDAIKMSAASKQVVVAASKLGKLKTVSQMIALCFLLVNNFPFSVLGIDLATILAWIATVISVISGIDYFIKNREMLMETM